MITVIDIPKQRKRYYYVALQRYKIRASAQFPWKETDRAQALDRAFQRIAALHPARDPRKLIGLAPPNKRNNLPIGVMQLSRRSFCANSRTFKGKLRRDVESSVGMAVHRYQQNVQGRLEFHDEHRKQFRKQLNLLKLSFPNLTIYDNGDKST